MDENPAQVPILIFFIPRDEASLDQYQRYPKITDIFPVNSVGIVTSRDDFVIDFEKEDLNRRIRMFRDKNLADDFIRGAFGLADKKGWKMTTSRTRVTEDEKWEEKSTQLSYRPFDVRWIFYHDDLIERTRREVMRHMLEPNLGLMTCRQLSQTSWHHAMVTARITDDCMVSNRTRERGYLFPLYLYPNDLLSKGSKTANLNPGLLAALKEAHRQVTSPEKIFCYVYSILYAETYRREYAEFLKSDFPRIPFTNDRTLFANLAVLGKKLVDLHLLESSDLDRPICRFQGKGINRIEKQIYFEKERRVYINDSQYFEGMEIEVWEYQIGGFQVSDKWLKDRETRTLTTEDIKHYCRIVTALAKTIEIKREIDKLYPEVEKEVVTISS